MRSRPNCPGPGRERRAGWRPLCSEGKLIEKALLPSPIRQSVKLVFLGIARIVIHPLTHFEALFASPLFCRDQAIERAHITLGKCPHIWVIVYKPNGHFLFFLRVGFHEPELASNDASGL